MFFLLLRSVFWSPSSKGHLHRPPSDRTRAHKGTLALFSIFAQLFLRLCLLAAFVCPRLVTDVTSHVLREKNGKSTAKILGRRRIRNETVKTEGKAERCRAKRTASDYVRIFLFFRFREEEKYLWHFFFGIFLRICKVGVTRCLAHLGTFISLKLLYSNGTLCKKTSGYSIFINDRSNIFFEYLHNLWND